MVKGKQAKWVVAAAALIVVVFAMAAGARAEVGDIALGKAVYEEECAVCHHTDGNGDGPAARFLAPRPRDFTTGVYKIRSTPSLATDEDLFRTITQGLPGTLMPSFDYLSKEDRWGLVAYVKGFSDQFKGSKSSESPDAIPDPPKETPELLAFGQQLYADAGCPQCHGRTGRGDGPAANTLTDRWEYPIVPYDFTIPGKMKGGSEVQDIYRALAVGIGGTPMPAYGESLDEEMIWALAYFTLSLAQPEEEPPIEGDPALGRDLIAGVTPFENGGPPCMGCHSVMGATAFGGGPWGPDLTRVHRKFKEDGLSTFLETIPLPTMRPLFGPRPISEEERGHLLAFLREMQPAGLQAVTVRVSPLYTPTILVGLLGVISLTLTGLIAGKKKVEVRNEVV